MIVLASSNKNKLKEFKELLKGYDIVLASDLNLKLLDEETGNSYLENAYLKAKFVYDQCHLPTLADDSGLEIKSLNGFPGIFSARFASDYPSFIDKSYLLVNMLKEYEDKTAFFKCGLVLIDHDGTIYKGLGQIEGLINDKYIGENGFGYDGIFKLKDKDITFGELDFLEKQRISHRANACLDLESKLPDKFKRRHKHD